MKTHAYSSNKICFRYIVRCRQYAVRRIKFGFRDNRNVSDPEVVEELLKKAQSSYEILQRQVS